MSFRMDLQISSPSGGSRVLADQTQMSNAVGKEIEGLSRRLQTSVVKKITEQASAVFLIELVSATRKAIKPGDESPASQLYIEGDGGLPVKLGDARDLLRKLKKRKDGKGYWWEVGVLDPSDYAAHSVATILDRGVMVPVTPAVRKLFAEKKQPLDSSTAVIRIAPKNISKTAADRLEWVLGDIAETVMAEVMHAGGEAKEDENDKQSEARSLREGRTRSTVAATPVSRAVVNLDAGTKAKINQLGGGH